MRINSIQNYHTFKGYSVSSPGQYDNRRQQPDNGFVPSPPSVEWKRRGIIALLLGINMYTSPLVMEYLKPEEQKQQEKAKEEYFESVFNLSGPAKSHFYKLGDIDFPRISVTGENKYNLQLALDNGEFVDFDINLEQKNSDKITGNILNNGSKQEFEMNFSQDNPCQFEVIFKNSEKKLTLGREEDGTLYKIQGNNKIILNSENVKRYEDYIDKLEELDSWKFFTNENRLWRDLNYFLLFYILLNEMAYEELKRRYYKNMKK